VGCFGENYFILYNIIYILVLLHGTIQQGIQHLLIYTKDKFSNNVKRCATHGSRQSCPWSWTMTLVRQLTAVSRRRRRRHHRRHPVCGRTARPATVVSPHSDKDRSQLQTWTGWTIRRVSDCVTHTAGLPAGQAGTVTQLLNQW